MLFFDTQRLNLLMTVDHRVEVGESHTHTESWYMGPGARNKKNGGGEGRNPDQCSGEKAK